MKSKRFCPGVPKRYKTRSSSTVIRPKSMAMVVVALTVRSAALLIFRSVDTTSISLMDWMNWVFPALNGPVTTIFTVCMGICAVRAA